MTNRFDSPWRAIRRWSKLLIALQLTCCGGEPGSDPAKDPTAAQVAEQPRDLVIDLLDDIDRATPRSEISRVALGQKRFLAAFGNNWIAPKPKADTEDFVLGIGERSTLDLFVIEPRTIKLKLVCEARSVPEGGQRTVDVSVGGHPIGRLELGSKLAPAELPIPASALRRGSNPVVFEYGGAVMKMRPKGGREAFHAYKMDCTEIAWLGLPDGAAPKQLPDGVLRLPAGAAMDFFVDLPPDARLSLERVASSGAALAIDVEDVGGKVRELPLGPASAVGQEPIDLRVELGQPGPTRVSLYAVGENGHLDIAGAGIEAPRAPPVPSAPAVPQIATGTKPNVVIFLVDTLRRDRLGTYGYGRPTSPNLDQFARRAVRFDRAMAQAPWTTPAVASLFTGLEPHSHGANGYGTVLPPQTVTLAELLSGAGYLTAAFSGSKPICRQTRFDQGFEEFADLGGSGQSVGPESPVVLERVESWLKATRPDRPLFMYVHTVDPHSPYDPPAEYRARLAPDVEIEKINTRTMLPENLTAVSQLYDGEVAFADASFGRFVATLKRHGLYDDSLIIFTADHGEQLMEHGGWRHESLWGEVLNIPLVVKLPAGTQASRGAVPEAVSQIDLLPTIAGLVGVKVPQEVEGRSLLPLMLPDRGEFKQQAIHGYVKKGYKEAWSLFDPPFKLVWRWYLKRRETHLFDLERDPSERHNLAEGHPVLREHLKARIKRERFDRKPLWKQPKDTPTEELTERMKALGYVQ